jgi:hypothetical protein
MLTDIPKSGTNPITILAGKLSEQQTKLLERKEKQQRGIVSGQPKDAESSRQKKPEGSQQKKPEGSQQKKPEDSATASGKALALHMGPAAKALSEAPEPPPTPFGNISLDSFADVPLGQALEKLVIEWNEHNIADRDPQRPEHPAGPGWLNQNLHGCITRVCNTLRSLEQTEKNISVHIPFPPH